MAVSKMNKVIICISKAPSLNINPKSDLVKVNYVKFVKVWNAGKEKLFINIFVYYTLGGVAWEGSEDYNKRGL